ncbi:MAG: hypothetical protein FWH27_12620 [Planctomycetaceae bacterium]|nr:hypothetical protein [Planctomycetaceae bacterium]
MVVSPVVPKKGSRVKNWYGQAQGFSGNKVVSITTNHFQEENTWAQSGKIIAKVFRMFKIGSSARSENFSLRTSRSRIHERVFYSRTVLRTLPHPVIVRRLPEHDENEISRGGCRGCSLRTPRPLREKKIKMANAANTVARHSRLLWLSAEINRQEIRELALVEFGKRVKLPRDPHL